MISLALALCLAADGGAPPFEWDVPGLLRAVPVGERLVRDGLPMRAFAVSSKWPIDRLLTHYRQRFAAAGYLLTPGASKLTLPKVAAYDDRRQLSLLVYGWSEPDGTTTLVLGSADLAHRVPPSAEGLGVPVFPGAKAAVRFELEGAHALSFSAQATGDEVIDFYRSVLPAGGWAEREPGTFVRQGRAVRVLARAAGPRLEVVVLDQADLEP